MKRQLRNKQNSALTNSRSLRIESLEDRQLMTVAAEMVQMPQESQIGSEHWPEPAAEIAVEKATNDRQGFFSRGLHNNGAFREPTGHILWTAKDDSDTSSDSYTDSGRVPYYAYELKNVQVTSVVAPVNFSHHANLDTIFGENGLGGQEGEAGTENQLSLNFEEIKVTYTENDNTGKKVGRSKEIVGGTLCSARSSNDPVFFSHHANVDKVFGARGTNYSWKVEEGEAVLAGNSDRLESFTPTTDLPDGEYYLQDKSASNNPKTLNFDLLGWT